MHFCVVVHPTLATGVRWRNAIGKDTLLQLAGADRNTSAVLEVATSTYALQRQADQLLETEVHNQDSVGVQQCSNTVGAVPLEGCCWGAAVELARVSRGILLGCAYALLNAVLGDLSSFVLAPPGPAPLLHCK